MIDSTMEAKFLHGIVVRTMLAFTQFGFSVRALLSDGTSANLSLMKMLCGHVDGTTGSISPWFTSPMVVVRYTSCAHHIKLIIHTTLLIFSLTLCACFMQLKNMVSALYSSQPNGTKNFMKNDTTFGWSTAVKIYNADLYRAKNGISEGFLV